MFDALGRLEQINFSGLQIEVLIAVSAAKCLFDNKLDLGLSLKLVSVRRRLVDVNVDAFCGYLQTELSYFFLKLERGGVLLATSRVDAVPNATPAISKLHWFTRYAFSRYLYRRR